MIETKSSRKILVFKTRTLIYLSRYFLGLVFPVAVLLRILNPQVIEAANFPTQAQAWLDTMKATGYLQNLVYTTELVTGLAILAGVLMPLALIAIAPIIVNIALFHFFLDSRPERIVLVLLIVSAYSILTYHYRTAFEPLFHSIKPAWSFRIVKGFSVRFAIQIIMSIIFVVAGSAKLIIPEQLNVGNLLIDSMKATGYLYTLLGITEVIAGLALWHRRLVPIALIILTPIAINIFFYHLFLAVAGLPIAILLLLAHMSLIVAYFPAYRTLLKIS
jgi:hypothetical protein